MRLFEISVLKQIPQTQRDGKDVVPPKGEKPDLSRKLKKKKSQNRYSHASLPDSDHHKALCKVRLL